MQLWAITGSSANWRSGSASAVALRVGAAAVEGLASPAVDALHHWGRADGAGQGGGFVPCLGCCARSCCIAHRIGGRRNGGWHHRAWGGLNAADHLKESVAVEQLDRFAGGESAGVGGVGADAGQDHAVGEVVLGQAPEFAHDGDWARMVSGTIQPWNRP